MNTSYYDVHKTFLRGLAARDIAEPLPSFDAATPAAQAHHSMLLGRHAVAGVRQDGFVCGYLEYQDLGDGVCGDYLHPFDEDTLIPNSTSITEVVLRLDRFPRLFVRSLGDGRRSGHARRPARPTGAHVAVRHDHRARDAFPAPHRC